MIGYFQNLLRWIHNIYIGLISDVENQLDSDSSGSISSGGIMELIVNANHEHN
jgi:hypothetical protein